MTNNLIHWVRQHKRKEHRGFTAQYDVSRLVYYEMFGDVRLAIEREKEIQGWTRKKKIALIESQNPKWEGLSQRWKKLLPKQKWQVRDDENPVGYPGTFLRNDQRPRPTTEDR